LGKKSWWASSTWLALDKNGNTSQHVVVRMSDCARCRRPLEEEGRFNVTYGGRAHWACQARAVWPPLGGVQQFEYNPMIALRKMARKEAFAGDEAQAHIQALMAIVGGDFNLPRPRQERRDSLSSDWDRGVQQVALSPLQSSTPPLAPTTPRSVAHTTPSERKRRQHPTPTPKTTPSPLAKNARANEPDPITQASEQQQPTTSKKTDHQQPARKEGKPTANEATVTVTNQYAQPTTRPTTRKGSRSKPIELEVTNENTRREYDLQQAIKAVGGKTVIEDTQSSPPNPKKRQAQRGAICHSRGPRPQADPGEVGGRTTTNTLYSM